MKKIKPLVKLLLGIVSIFLFTQINWSGYFFSNKKNTGEDIENTALFYTESEKAGEIEFLLRKK